MAKAQTPTGIDSCISNQPAAVQAVLQKVRETISNAAPDAKETISYQMPAFRQHGILVCFAAWKSHIGLYPPICGDKVRRKQSLGTLGRRATFSSHWTSRSPTT